MIALDKPTRLSTASIVYVAFGRALGSVIFILGGLILSIFGGAILTANGSGAGIAVLIGVALILVGIGVLVYLFLFYLLYTYTVTDHSITIDSGVIFRDSRTIDFKQIQSVDSTRGPIQMLLGVTSVNIWTASPDQMHLSVHQGTGTSDVSTLVDPDALLVLQSGLAEELRSRILNKWEMK
jgi:uncharacterized membrane protein YdbT with pleckstrin-like domain